MKTYTRIKFLNVFGAPVSIHWSAIIVIIGFLILSIGNPFLGLITMCSYFGIILLHESGHAYLAKKLGYNVYNIYLGFVHGLCEYEEPYNQKDESIVAWGGVIAQLIVAIPLMILAQFGISEIMGMGPIVVFLGYISFTVALMNLAPSSFFDGGKAWKLIPIIINEKKESIQEKRKYAKKKKAKEKLKVIK